MYVPRFLPRCFLIAVLIFAGFAAIGGASAERLWADNSGGSRDHDAARQGVRTGQLVPLSQVIRTVKARYPGQLLDASMQEIAPGQPAYRVLILMSDGRRVAVWVDARTGRILRVEG